MRAETFEEPKTNSLESKQEKKLMSTFLSRLIAAGVSIITLCVSTILLFIWDMKGDYAAEKVRNNEKNSSMLQSINEIKSDVKQTSLDVQLLKENSARTDVRIQSIERKVN